MFRLIIILFVLTFNLSYKDLEYNYKYPDTFIDVNKSISTKIDRVGEVYKYKTIVEWKNIPNERGYDIIALIHDEQVKNIGEPIFNVNYCISNSCFNNSYYTYDKFENGIGITFKLPEGKIDSLIIKLSYYVKTKKDFSNLVVIADYKHKMSNTNCKYNNYNLDNDEIKILANEDFYDKTNQSKGYWFYSMKEE